MNIRVFSYLLLVVTALVVVVATTVSDMNLLTYLDLSPLIVCAIVFEGIIRVGGREWSLLSPIRRAVAFGLVVGVVLPLLTSNIGWLLGSEGVVVNQFSIEAFLEFLFIPFVAFVSGIFGGIAGGIIGWYKNKTTK
jgi:hypothetical protein